MKKFLTVLLSIVLAATAMNAQPAGHSFKKGYRGNISLGGSYGVTKGISWNSVSFSTSHGYSFGDGIYLGVGVGMNFQMSEEFNVPVFIDAKYNIIDWKLSPFVDCRLGGEYIFDDEGGFGPGIIVSPGIGVDFHRFTLRIGYMCEAGRYKPYESASFAFKLHSITTTIAFNF